jgi:nicotinate dehydrogenase subunit B
MTGLLNERDFSRKTFLKGGGAMIVGFSMLGAGFGAKAAKAADDPFASNGPYDQTAVDSWLVIHGDNTATVKLGKVELGQGTLTGLLMIAADELDLSMSQLKYVNHDTNVTPNQGATVGSQGIQTGGKQLRAAAASARSALLGLAATSLGVAKTGLTVKDGVVSGGGKTVTYGALIGDKLFNTKISGFSASGTATSPAQAVAGSPGTKPVGQYKVVGVRGTPRVDIPAKVTGGFTYVHNIRVPGMIHGRVVRPRGQGAYGGGTAPAVISVDEGSIAHIPDAKVVRFANFVGVVAPVEYSAIQAAAQLKVKWAPMPPIRDVGNLFKGMRDDDTADKAPARLAVNTGNFDAAFAGAAKSLVRTYKYHYTGHMPIGPSCCVADVTPNGARVFTNTQDAYGTRQNVKDALDLVMGAKTLPLNRIRLTYYEGSSVYGSAPYRDNNQAAAIMSAITGKPVRVQFMRWDEHGYDNYGPAQMTDIRAGVDANGKLTAFEYTAFGIPYMTTQPAEQQVGGRPVFSMSGPLDTTISGSQYSIPNRRVIGKSLPLQNNYFKVSYLRAPNAPQSSFAAEQAVDELAYMAKMDPVAFRLQNVANTKDDPPQRWKNVLTAAAADAKWQPKVAASNLGSGNVVSGRGVAFGFYSNTMSCCVADIEVNKKTGKILTKALHVAGDAGLIVYPEGSENNEEGAAIQGLSRALVEELAFNKTNVTGLDWVTYPMLRFKDTPTVFIHGLSRTDVPDPSGPGSRTTGSGEPALTPVAAAVANAFFDATGVRLYEAPMTPGRVRAALAAAAK